MCPTIFPPGMRILPMAIGWSRMPDRCKVLHFSSDFYFYKLFFHWRRDAYYLYCSNSQFCTPSMPYATNHVTRWLPHVRWVNNRGLPLARVLFASLESCSFGNVISHVVSVTLLPWLRHNSTACPCNELDEVSPSHEIIQMFCLSNCPIREWFHFLL